MLYYESISGYVLDRQLNARLHNCCLLRIDRLQTMGKIQPGCNCGRIPCTSDR